MTNFVAAFHPEGALPSHLLRLDTQPRAQRVETIGESPASIAYQTVIKPIDDRILRSRASGSWVALLGTPLLPAWTGNPDGDEKFAESFFHSPAAVLRDVLDGHFVLVAYDAKNRRLYVATDYNNLIPVFYCRERTTSIFSGSDLTLALLKGPKIDPVGVTQSVALGANLEACSRVMGITRMSSCELVTVDEHHGLKSERYWRPACEVVSTRTFDEVLDEWTSKLQAAIRAFHARSPEPVVRQDLTGGEDARLVLAQVHALGIPYTIRVSGAEGDSDVRVVRRIAGQLGLPLEVQPPALIESADLLEHARAIVAGCDGYGSFFGGCESFATKKAYPGPPMSRLRLTGSAGGERFRGVYYARAKLARPSRIGQFDYRFFMRMKFLLDVAPGLFRLNDDVPEQVHEAAQNALQDVAGFPTGLQVDHLVREFQTCTMGLQVRWPVCWPLATRELTRSVYWVPPKYKAGGRLTRACTERAYPELARMRTATGVPTIRMTPLRFPLFLPGQINFLKRVLFGALRRKLRFGQSSPTLGRQHRIDLHGPAMKTLLTREPYSKFFLNADTMLTGECYNPDRLNAVLSDAREGKCHHVLLLGRIINAELAFRLLR